MTDKVSKYRKRELDLPLVLGVAVGASTKSVRLFTWLEYPLFDVLLNWKTRRLPTVTFLVETRPFARCRRI